MPSRKTTEQFIAEARQIHGDAYDYSKVNYVNSKVKIEIICLIHGSWLCTPSNHLHAQTGCPQCGRTTQGSKMSKTTQEFIAEAHQLHDDTYDYSKVIYTRRNRNVIIICLRHGEFVMTPSRHLKGDGCEKCYYEMKDSTPTFIAMAVLSHGDRYDYSKVEYTGPENKVIIICRTHGEFKQKPISHLRGDNCKKCVEAEQRSIMTCFMLNTPPRFHYLSDPAEEVSIMCDQCGFVFRHNLQTWSQLKECPRCKLEEKKEECAPDCEDHKVNEAGEVPLEAQNNAS